MVHNLVLPGNAAYLDTATDMWDNFSSALPMIAEHYMFFQGSEEKVVQFVALNKAVVNDALRHKLVYIMILLINKTDRYLQR